MTLESMKSKVRKDILAAIERHLDSPEELYVRMQNLDGVYAVEVLKAPVNTAVEFSEPELEPDRSTMT